jgi:hypothetical protein
MLAKQAFYHLSHVSSRKLLSEGPGSALLRHQLYLLSGESGQSLTAAALASVRGPHCGRALMS